MNNRIEEDRGNQVRRLTERVEIAKQALQNARPEQARAAQQRLAKALRRLDQVILR